MDIRSIEFSASFLESIADLPENARKGALDGLVLEVSEIAPNVTTLFAGDETVVGWMIVDTKDGATAHFALKRNSDEIHDA